MSKQIITEEMHPEREWFEKADKIVTTEELKDFVDHLLNDYKHDYGTVCHAISACALAAAHLAAKKEGITGFQAGAIMWDFIRQWMYPLNECGLRIINYDDMLYPQYEYKFDKTISKDVWDSLQNEAKKKLKDKSFAAPVVVGHWRNIAYGIVPFGYKVTDEDD